MTDRDEAAPDHRDPGGERRRPLSRFLLPITRYVITNLVVAPVVILLFFVFNRTRVYGRHRVPNVRNTLLLSNHQSMIDSFPVGYSAFFPQDMWKPYLAPWNPAAEENFFRNPLFRWLFDQLKCIPVRQGRRDPRAIYRSVQALRGSTMILFPEGTRSRDGSVGKGRAGAGVLILETRPHVIPVAIQGMDRVLPIGRIFPRVGQRISVYFGRPLAYDDLETEEFSRKTAQEVVDRVMERIRFQGRVIRRLEGGSRDAED